MRPLFTAPTRFVLEWTLFVLVGCAPATGFGKLVWDTQKIEVTTKPADKTGTGTFGFINDGKAPVTITSLESDCGCTTAELAKRTYAPGEKGEVKVIFTIGDRVGAQEKKVFVFTEPTEAESTVLTLRVTVPELLTYSARLLAWKMTEELQEKSIVVTNVGSEKIVAIETSPRTGTTDEATIRIETIEAGKKYAIFAKPRSLERDLSLPLGFVAKFADGTTRTFPLYVLVR